MKLTIKQNAFTTGLVGKEVFGRNDVSQFVSGLSVNTNATILEQGPLKYRPGTIFVGEVKDSSKTTRIEPFTYSVDDSLLLEVGENYIRFYLDDALILTDYNYALTNSWDGYTAYVNGDLMSRSSVIYRCIVDETVKGTFDSTEWENIGLVSDTWTDEDKAYELYTDFTEDEISELDFTGTADLIYIAHKNHHPLKLSRYADDDWTIEEVPFIDGPFGELNSDFDSTVTLDSVDEDTDVTVTATMQIFDPTMVGRLFRIQKRETTLEDGAVALMTISEYLSPQSVMATLSSDVDADFAVSDFPDWRFGAFVEETAEPDEFYALTLNVRETYELEDLTAIFIEQDDEYNSATQYKRQGLFDYDSGEYPVFLRFNGSDTWNCGIFDTDETTLLENTWNVAGTASVIPKTGWLRTEVDPDSLGNVTFGPCTLTDAADEFAVTAEWPSLVELHQERLIFGGTTSQPLTLWFSVIADYDSFAPTNGYNEQLDDSAFVYSLSGKDVSDLAFLLSSDSLAVGTNGALYTSHTSDEMSPITPTDISFIRQPGEGAAKYQTPIIVNGAVVYAQRLGTAVKTMPHRNNEASYNSLNKFVPNLFVDNGSVSYMRYSPEPSSNIYINTDNGNLFVLTWNQEESVLAWSEYVLGGTASVSGLAILPRSSKDYYNEYVLVERTINGETKQYIERFTSENVTDSNYWGYLDCHLTYHDDTTAISTATGLDHLEGETVTIFADGNLIGTGTVASGEVALGGSYNHVVVGYPYSMTCRMLPIDLQPNGDDTFGKKRRTILFTTRVVDTKQLSAGVSTSALYSVIDEDTIVDGIHSMEIDEDHDEESGEIYFQHSDPSPCTILAVAREIEFRD